MAVFSPTIVGDAIEAAANKAAQTLSAKLPDKWEVTREGSSLAPATGYYPLANAYRPLRPLVSWPGAVSIVSCSYSNSHGINPGCATVVLNPQMKAPATFGTLYFGDGIRPAVPLRDAHCDKMTPNIGSGSAYITLQISDRRWRWLQGYMVHGEYNRLDQNGKLVPWTVRSAKELAIICLKAMGERRYVIAFPPGLTNKQATTKYDRYLRAGERFPLTYANPYVNWDHIPAAVALQRLAELFGCRVMYDPISDKVGVLPVGYGDWLPYGGTSVNQASQSVEASRKPRRVGICGAPLRVQGRWPLEAVGKDYDEYRVPINDLTYAPVTSGVGVTPEIRGWERCPPPGFTTVEPTERLEYTEAVKFAQSSVFREYRILRGSTEPYGSAVTSYVGSLGTIDYEKVFALKTWDKMVTGPEEDKPKLPTSKQIAALGPGLAGLEKLSVKPASSNQLVNPYVKTKLVRRQQFVITPNKVVQIVPAPRRDTDIVVRPNRDPKEDPGALPDYYNGYSRDRPAECFGTYYAGCTSTSFDLSGSDIVTKRRVYTPFEIDAVEQCVRFADYLYTLTGTGEDREYKPAADLYLETSALVLHSETNAVIRPKFWIELGGSAPDVWETHEDVIVNLVIEYRNTGAPLEGTGSYVEDLGDGKARAQYYLQGLKRRYQDWQSQTVTYNGCMLIPPSGTVQQIFWSLTSGPGGGVYTTASANNEFLPNIPPYPQRLLAENLPPNERQKVLNEASSPWSARKLATLPLYTRGS